MPQAKTIIRNISFPLPEKEIFSRLGYSRHRTELPSGDYAALLNEMRRLFAMCRPCGVSVILPTVKNTDGFLTVDGGKVIASRDISEIYGDCDALFFGAVTIGAALPEYARSMMAREDARMALLCDAVGSESADAAMDFLQKRTAMDLCRRNMALSRRRFSPGYGDWGLAAQQLFSDLLDMPGTLGVRLSDSMIMEPEKSVTALAGVNYVNK